MHITRSTLCAAAALALALGAAASHHEASEGGAKGRVIQVVMPER